MIHVDGAEILDERTSTFEHESAPLASREKHSGLCAWKQGHGGFENRQPNSEPPFQMHSSKKALSMLNHSPRCNRSKHSHQSKAASPKFGMSSSSKLSAQLIFKRVAHSQDMSKQVDSSDTSDVMDEGDETGGRRKVLTSKNLMSERKRRHKLNERLYSLRALVPNISKMDKASIVSDAIRYVQTLRNQVDIIQGEIVDLEAHKQSPSIMGSGEEDPRRNSSVADCQETIKQEHRIVKLEVSQMEEHTYHLRIHCKKTPGVLVQLTRALEALEINILNANISSVDNHILNTVVVEVKDRSVMKSEDLRSMARTVIRKFGFSFC